MPWWFWLTAGSTATVALAWVMTRRDRVMGAAVVVVLAWIAAGLVLLVIR